MEKKRSIEQSLSSRSSPTLEADESMHEDRRADLFDTPIHRPALDDDNFPFPYSSGVCSSRKKPKMEFEYLPRFSNSAGALLPPPPSVSSSDASNSSSSSNNSSNISNSQDFLVSNESPCGTISYASSPGLADGTPGIQTATVVEHSRSSGVLQEITHEDQVSETLMICSPTTHHYFQFKNLFTPVELSHPPLPGSMKSLTDAEDIWKSMLKKEAIYRRSSSYLTKHRDLQCRMRSLLVDWMMEVCEEYKLKRTTLYLACEFFDRYMTNTSGVVKTRLQLIGITALFIASKAEEIYPPRLSVFVDLTDGACEEKDVISQELLMLHKLDWMLSPVTPIMWLQLYVQLAFVLKKERSTTLNSSFAMVVKNTPKELLINIAQLLDLCLLDLEYLEFPPSILAATALYHCTNAELVTSVSSYNISELSLCIKWMHPFAISYRESLKCRKGVTKEVLDGDGYTTQTHTSTLQHLDHALECRERINLSRDYSPTSQPNS